MEEVLSLVPEEERNTFNDMLMRGEYER